MDILRYLMDNGLTQVLIGALVGLIVSILGYIAAAYRYRAKSAEKDIEIERENKERVGHEKDLELEKTRLELRLQTERAENERAIREAMLLSMRRVDTLEKEQERVKDQLRVTHDQYSEAKEMVEDLQAQVIQRDRASEARTKEIERLTSEVNDLQTRVTTTETEREKLLKVIAQKDKEIEELKRVAQKDIKERDTRINELIEKMRVMERELQDVRQELDALKASSSSPDMTPDTNGKPPTAPPEENAA